MRISLTLTLLIFINNVLICQDFKYIKPDLGDSCEIISSISDTAEMYEQLVFIDYKKDSKLKRSLADFKLTDSRINQIRDSYNRIQEKSDNSSSKHEYNLPNNWIKIHKYRGEWILYDDIEFNSRYILSDTALISFFMDGTYAEPLIDFKSKDKKYKFKFASLSWDDSQSISEHKLDIKIIDPQLLIAIWRFESDGSIYYNFMIPEKNKEMFPIIGIITTDLMGNESNILDSVDFEEIFKK
ncbi:hypothetical protein ACE1ET_20165 [Saccharicrinis sp. FJH62]|uniref:hypothetical protein n=1 Tax=Saccharicrinis sp. FJH62 TaxID=3344657 RepID=UPI0035D41095